MRLVASSMNERMVQSPVQPQIVYAKLRRISSPRSVCATSGWNSNAYKRRERSSMAATGAFALVAITAKPGGAEATRSPWLAHTRSSSGMAVKIGAVVLSLTRTSAWPYSRCGAGATSPPSAAVISCMP
jgi:hypothetical protein